MRSFSSLAGKRPPYRGGVERFVRGEIATRRWRRLLRMDGWQRANAQPVYPMDFYIFRGESSRLKENFQIFRRMEIYLKPLRDFSLYLVVLSNRMVIVCNTPACPASHNTFFGDNFFPRVSRPSPTHVHHVHNTRQEARSLFKCINRLSPPPPQSLK